MGAVNHGGGGGGASATSLYDFPHRVMEINGAGPEALGTSRRRVSSDDGQESPNERHGGRSSAATIGAGARRIPARVFGVEMREYHPLDTRRGGRDVEPADGDNSVADDSPAAPGPTPPPCSSFILKRDDEEFGDAREEYVRGHDGNDRSNSNICSSSSSELKCAIHLLLIMFGGAVFLSPLWGLLFWRPLIYVVWGLGVITCALHVLAFSVWFAGWLMAVRLPRPGDGVGPSALVLLKVVARSLLWAVACYCVVWFARYLAFGVMMIGDYTLTFMSIFALVQAFTRCGVLKGGKVPILNLTVEPQPPSFV